MGSRGAGPVDSRSMFAGAGCFSVILLGMSAFVLYGEGEEARILAQGTKTRVAVVEMQKDRKGTTSLLIRLPGREPFWRVYTGADRDRLKAGDTLPYAYESEYPEAGVLGAPAKRNNAGMFALVFGVFVAPFLLIGVILRRRERAKISPAP